MLSGNRGDTCLSYFDKRARERLTEEVLRRLRRAGQAAQAGLAAIASRTSQFLRRAENVRITRRFRSTGKALPARPFSKAPRFWISLAVIVAALLSSV